MTKKRFQYNVNKNSIESDGKHFAYCNGGQSKIAKKLNELHEEKRELRIQYNNLREQSNEFHRITRENVNKVGKLEKENDELKKKIGNLEHTRDFCADVCADCERLEKENEQLKENQSWLEWEKHIGDVKREDLDRVFKMSIYEIAEAFEYYEKRIEELSE